MLEKISWTNRVKIEEVLYTAKEERNILHRNCLLKHVIERKMEEKLEGARRRKRRRKQLLNCLKRKANILEIERGSTRSHSMENWLCKRLWTCRKTDYVINTLFYR
jgi:uncharacterized membrane protein YgaE (UPF0421/DUF939 family)